MVLIVEAREKSGSLITAQWALDQGKTVYAIPGPVNEELSIGCHKLIYDGAGIAYSPEILLRELGMNYENKVKSDSKNDLGLASDLKLVYSCLDLRPKSTDFLIQKTGLPPDNRYPHHLQELRRLLFLPPVLPCVLLHQSRRPCR